MFDQEPKAGGMIRTQIPRFRLPESIIDEECDYILDLGSRVSREPSHRQPESAACARVGTRYSSVRARRAAAISIFPAATKAPPTSTSALTGCPPSHSGTSTSIGKRVIVLGGGNTAMDCCRSARRLGGEDVKVIVRSGFEEMKASPWEKEDAMHEDIPILNFLVPKEFTHRERPPHGRAVSRRSGPSTMRRGGALSCRPESPTQHFACDDVLVAVGQENAFPWIERDIGVNSINGTCRKSIAGTMASTHPKVFFGGDAAFGPKEHHLGGRARP